MYDLSLIIPIYNEEHRLHKTFIKLNNFTNKNKNKIEVVFVNDGSTDLSTQIVKKFISGANVKNKLLSFKLITYSTNVGKGYDVKKGVLNSKYSWILICDSDFSTKPSQFDQWYKKNYIVNNNYRTAYFGSRNHELSKIKASILRVFFGTIFRQLTYLLFKITLKDTQCGFKVFHKRYAKNIFKKIKSYRYAFDIELILLLKNYKISIEELPVKWNHENGSKLSLLTDMPKMFLDILKIRMNYPISSKK